ncbi:hypothetical protein K2X85_08370 [bacterium]|nr:hypothetical protein [bacterium]
MSRFLVLKRGLALVMVFAGLCGFSVKGRAGIIIPGNEAAHIAFAADPIFQSVGWVSGFDGSQWFTVGSGVLIDQEWVMLTGHELTTFGYSTYRFSLGPSVFQPNTGRSVASSYFVAGSGGNFFNPDLGLLQLSTPITTVTPATVYQGNDLAEGMRVVFAGYGRLGYYPSGELAFDGVKRAGENVIENIGPTAGIAADRIDWDFGPAYGTSSLPLEMTASNFDSGSGAFAFIDGEWQLVGIVAQGAPLRYTVAVRPSAYTSWTNEIIGVPEPSSFMLALTGAAGAWMITRMRRRT